MGNVIMIGGTGNSKPILPEYTGSHAIFGDAINGYMELYSSGTLSCISNIILDVCAAGGGGGGGLGRNASSGAGAGGGGGGGYVEHIFGFLLNQPINVTIGLGGKGGTSTTAVSATDGSPTYFGSSLTALGGKAGEDLISSTGYGGRGGNGGSGGGAGGGASSAKPGAGGSNGSNGIGESGVAGGIGSGRTTVPFGDSTIFKPLGAGGGGGGYNIVGADGGYYGGGKGAYRDTQPAVAGLPNTGGGGGGGKGGNIGTVSYQRGADGGSGIVIIRWGKVLKPQSDWNVFTGTTPPAVVNNSLWIETNIPASELKPLFDINKPVSASEKTVLIKYVSKDGYPKMYPISNKNWLSYHVLSVEIFLNGIWNMVNAYVGINGSWQKISTSGYCVFVSPANGVLRKVDLTGQTVWEITFPNSNYPILDCAIDWVSRKVYALYTTDNTSFVYIATLNLDTGDIIYSGSDKPIKLVVSGISGAQISLSPNRDLLAISTTYAADRTTVSETIFQVIQINGLVPLLSTNLSARTVFFAENGSAYAGSGSSSAGYKTSKVYPSQVTFSTGGINYFTTGLRTQILLTSNAVKSSACEEINLTNDAYRTRLFGGNSYTPTGWYYIDSSTIGLLTNEGIRVLDYNNLSPVKHIITSSYPIYGFQMPDGNKIVVMRDGIVALLNNDDTTTAIASTTVPSNANGYTVNCFRCEPAHECTFPELFPL